MAKIILPDIKDLENYNNQELLQLIRTMEKRLRSRETALEKAGLSEFSNFGGVSPRGFKFSKKQAQKSDSARRILIARYKKLKAALDNPRNTIKGAKYQLKKKLSTNGETTGAAGHARYTAIMDMVAPGDRDEVRGLDSNDVFKYSEIALENKEEGLLTYQEFKDAMKNDKDNEDFDPLSV